MADHRPRPYGDKFGRTALITTVSLIAAMFVSTALIDLITNRPPPRAIECKTNYTTCADNADLMDNYTRGPDSATIQEVCDYAAQMQVHDLGPHWRGIRFTEFSRRARTFIDEAVVAISADTQFPNGFGQKIPTKVTCLYNLRTDKIMFQFD